MEGRRLGPEDIPSSPAGEGGSGDERVGEDERVDEAGPGAALMRTGPWNRRVHPAHSANGSEARSRCCPRRMEGSFVDCWVKACLKGNKRHKSAKS